MDTNTCILYTYSCHANSYLRKKIPELALRTKKGVCGRYLQRSVGSNPTCGIA